MICALKGAAAIQDCHSNARRDNGAQTDAFMHHGYDIYNTVTGGPTKKPMNYLRKSVTVLTNKSSPTSPHQQVLTNKSSS